jgi:hypothetical protein
VAQLYISHPNVEGAPISALCGFERIHLDPGESLDVHFAVGER